MRIRPAELVDGSRLFELVGAFPTPTPPDLATFSAALQAKLPDPSSYVGLAELDGRLIGYVSGYCHPTFYAGGYTAWVDELLVESGFRGRGVGRNLMDAFEAWAAARQCRLVSLATSGATGFYEHLGYRSKAGYFKKYLDPEQ